MSYNHNNNYWFDVMRSIDKYIYSSVPYVVNGISYNDLTRPAWVYYAGMITTAWLTMRQ